MVCLGGGQKSYSVPSDPNSNSYTWTWPAGVTPVSTPPYTNTIILNFTNTAVSGNITVCGTNSDCGNGPLSTLAVTISPLPSLTTNLSQVTCSGTSFTIPLTSTPSGSTYTWAAPAPTCSPNIAAPCPPGNTGTSISGTVSVTNFSQGTVTYHVTPSLNGCSGETKNLVLTVKPLPDVSTNPHDFSSICDGFSTNFSLSSSIASSTLAWDIFCTNITSCPASGTGASGDIISDVLTLHDPLASGTATYHITPAFDGCTGIPADHTVTVNPIPIVTLSSFVPVCLNTPPFLLSGGSPIGGEYWLNSVKITQFDPALAGVGTHTIVYTYIDVNGCTSSDNKDIIVQDLITPNLNGNSTACLGVEQPFTTDAGMISGSYQWVVTPDGNMVAGSSPEIINITWPTTGSKTISVTYTDPNGCTTIPAYKTVLVNGLPNPSLTGNFNTCVGQAYSYNSDPGMSGYSWNVSAGNSVTFTDNTAAATWNVIGASQWIEVNYSDANGCFAAIPVRIPVNVNPSPDFAVTGLANVCAGSSSSYSLPLGESGNWSILTSGGSISGPSTNVNSISVNWFPTTNPPPSQSLLVGYTNTLGCSNTTIKTVTVQALPVSTFTSSTPSPVCQDYPAPSVYTVDPGGPTSTYSWVVTPPANAAIADPAANPAAITWKLSGSSPQNALLTLNATTLGTTPVCSSNSSVSITINPKPPAQLTPCFELVTNRSAKRFLLKGGTPLLTSTPLQGEYLSDPSTTALSSDASGNFYFNPALVTGTNTRTFDITYRYTSSQYGCIATSPSATLTVMAANPVSCSGSMTDVRDGTVYTTALLPDGRCWMTKNLRYGTALSPSTVPQTDNCTVEKYCLSSDPACTANGGFYQWDELIQFGNTDGPAYQGVCPPGWHIPTQQEWQSLINSLAGLTPGDGVAGGYLKDQNQANGFRVLLKGIYYLNNTWAFITGNSLTATMFWTSTPNGSNRAIARGMNNYNYSVSFYPSSRANAFPVRCVKD